MQQTTVVTSNSKAYIILALVLFLHDGHAEHKHEAAVEVQQHAKVPSEIMAPILL
jgi:hypothetical protein